MNDKIYINNMLYDIIDINEVKNNFDKYKNSFVAVVLQGKFVVPVINNVTKKGVDLNSNKLFHHITNTYRESTDKTIRFSSAENMIDLLEKSDSLACLEKEILESSDNITTAQIKESDSPQSKAMKTAINNKKIDMKLYKGKNWGEKFDNDYRTIIQGPGLSTISKYTYACDKLDLEVEIVLRDKPNAPNPMGEGVEVRFVLNGGQNEN